MEFGVQLQPPKASIRKISRKTYEKIEELLFAFLSNGGYFRMPIRLRIKFYPMPTQNFLSTDFFLLSSEEETRKVLLSLPEHYSTITLLKENLMLHSTRFLVENPEKQLQHYIDVSVLTLNDQHVLVRLHGSYTNGKSFHSDPDLWQAIKQFESALSLLLEKGEKLAVETKHAATSEKKVSFFSQAFFSLFARSI